MTAVQEESFTGKVALVTGGSKGISGRWNASDFEDAFHPVSAVMNGSFLLLTAHFPRLTL